MLKEFKDYLKSGIFLLFLIPVFPLCAQEYSFGLKAGLGYTINQKAAEVDGSAGSFSADSKIGFLGGAFLEVGFGKFFVRPEVFYSHAEGEFAFPDLPSTYSVDKISIPLLLGYNIYGPVDIFAGPAYQEFLQVDLENTASPVEVQQRNFATQLGVKLVLNRLEIDLRYDFTLDSKRNQLIDVGELMDEAYFDDGRLNQIMLSIGYRIFDTANPRRARSNRGCYF
ncbi:outer membrane beta-barrel protein [Autumnicola musiva]|uniref:Outer membrane protein beta-barrel domain-containing protein n=1 Tax=Autumnicola musiva TaxID=3075589 RepID=A0ABU3D9L1_9FLAO|nr:outer membrane beta-barrel protein [Zunongwangia sp. F117]MDT0677673.1 hypothetical protein [Zunongwangia sp. F117]